MGHRLTKIATRTGDKGTTGLGDGTRVDKDCHRIEAMGDIDELNSVLGVLLSERLHAGLRSPVLSLQNDLFDLGSELCLPGRASFGEERVARLDALLEELNRDLPPLKEFILPGGTRAATLAHLARAVCRRAERHLVHLGRSETVGKPALRYVNRLSDVLFVLGRAINRRARAAETYWKSERLAAMKHSRKVA